MSEDDIASEVFGQLFDSMFNGSRGIDADALHRGVLSVNGDP